MWESFKKWLDENRDYGVTFWFAYDPVTEKPSITLFMAYVSFFISVVSVIWLHFSAEPIMATAMSFLLCFVMVIFYLIRSINKASVSLKEQSFAIENNEEKNESK